jgi:CreA protein
MFRNLGWKAWATIVAVVIVAIPLSVFLLARWFSSGDAEISVTRGEPDTIGCLSTTFRIFSPNDKICITALDDPKVPGVACHISQARTGGWTGAMGFAEDRSLFSIACRQTGPITLPQNLPRNEEAFSTRTSLIFKSTRVFRMYDPERRTLVYLAMSTRFIEGSPNSSISSVPIMPWRE